MNKELIQTSNIIFILFLNHFYHEKFQI